MATDFQFYLDHKAEYLAAYPGKVLVIKNGNLLGVYETPVEAIQRTTATGLPIGSFLVQVVGAGDEQTRFRSRHA